MIAPATAQLSVTGRPDDVRTIVHAIRDGQPIHLTLIRDPHKLDEHTVAVHIDATVERRWWRPKRVAA